MTNKQTAVEWLIERLARKHNEFQALTFYYDHKEEISQARAMEKEQMIKFAQIVLDKAECSHTGMVYLDRDIEDIYTNTLNFNKPC